MSEEVKTVSVLGVALVAAIVAFVVSRKAPERMAAEDIGKAFVEVENPLDVKQLKIVEFDSETGRSEPFEVAQVGGLYSIPSHENYPADARDHLVDAVNFVNNVEILANVSDSSGSHEDFGVVDPTSDALGRGAAGVGTRVTMSDQEGSPLADFIIGKEVKGASGQRYVRRADKDQVYTVEIDPSKLSTRFEDWIERDLLKLDAFDIEKVAISDYAVQTRKELVLGPDGPFAANVVTGLDMKSSIDLTYDTKDYEWQLDNLVVFDKGKPEEKQLGDDEELNTTKLNDLKSALDDLEIVDVRRKVKGLGSDLSQFIKENPEATSNLEAHGFFFRGVEGPDGKPQYMLLSNNGEITVGMKDGVEYALRFGNVAGAEKQKDDDSKEGDAETPDDTSEGDEPETDEDDGEQADEEAGEGDDKGTKVLRYLFVLTQLNSNLIAKPELEEVPPEEPPAAEKPAAEKPAEEKPAEEKPADEDEPTDDADAAADESQDGEQGNQSGEDSEPADDSAPADGTEDADEEQPSETPESTDPTGDAAQGQPSTEDTPAAAGEEDAAGGEPATEAGGDGAADDTPAGDKPEANEEAEADQTDADGDQAETEEEDPAKKLEEWKEKRQTIIDENERKQQEYDENIEKAKQRVEELNQRFADWYYVISDETYHKIHLSKNDIVKEKEKTEEDKQDGVDASAGEDEQKDSLEKFDELRKGLED